MSLLSDPAMPKIPDGTEIDGGDTLYNLTELKQALPTETPNLLCGYIKHEELGSGAYATVYRVEDPKTHISYALKQFVELNKDGVYYATVKELNILASFNHPNLVKPHKIFTDNSDEISCNICLVLEFMDNNLHKHIKENRVHSDRDVLFIFRQLVYGLDFLHENNVIHNDLKPENILVKYTSDLNSPLIKISDLDCMLCPHGREEQTRETCTLWYRAPELLNYPANVPNFFSNKIDIWSLGCILYQLFTGIPLFLVENEAKLKNRIDMVLANPKIFEIIPREYRPLLKAMLSLNPKHRPSTRVIINKLDFSDYIVATCSFNRIVPKLDQDFNLYIQKLVEYVKPRNEALVFLTCSNILELYMTKKTPEDARLAVIVAFLLAGKLFGNEFSLAGKDRISGFSKDQINLMECDMISTLDFKLYTKIE